MINSLNITDRYVQFFFRLIIIIHYFILGTETFSCTSVCPGAITDVAAHGE